MRKKRLVAVLLSAVMVFVAAAAYLPQAETVAADTTSTTDDSSTEDMNLVNTLTGYYTFDDTLENSVSGSSASLHGGAGDTWNSAATGTASYSSSNAKSGSAYEFSGNSNTNEYVTLSGSTSSTGWWTSTDYGTAYTLASGGSAEFTVSCASNADDGSTAVFVAEILDESGHCITTGSYGDAWADSGSSTSATITGVLDTKVYTISENTSYRVTFSHDASTGAYTIVYFNETTGELFDTYTLTDTNLSGTITVRIAAVIGSFNVRYNDSSNITSGEGLKLDVTTSDAYTISMWVYTEQKVNYQPVFLAINDSSYYVTAGTYYNNFASGGIANYGNTWYWLDRNTNSKSTLKDLPVNTWTYVTLTMTSDGVVTLYYNGEVLSTQTISGYASGNYTGMPIYLGINWWDTSFCGLMDEVTVYSSALTADEVYTLYTYNGNPNDAADAEESGDLATSVSHVSVHDPSIVKGYVEESVTELTSSTEIVGVADGTHTKGVYFIFGSHLAFAYSWDLMDWTTFTNNITTDYNTLFAEEATWSANGTSGTYDLSGNMWAPDVIWNTTMNCWCMYMSINGDNWYSTICMLTSDSLYGDWTYVGMVIQSGNYNYASTGATFDYYTATGETESDNNLSRYTANRNGNLTYEDNCIDPCVIYDESGNLWMTYGSWFGGIWMIKLDASTGLRDYDTTYTYVENETDPYQGYKLAGGFHSSGEASYIEYINGYYYLFVTYGGLTATGGYNMRVYRSDSITGPYTDESGDAASYTAYTNNYATGSNLVSTLGMRLMSQYKWSYQTYAQVAQGHNSVYYDEDTDQIYLVYHTRTNDGTEGHTVRVHQLFQNEDGWLVTAPFEYAGETTTTADITSTSYSAEDIAGSYEIIVQATAVDYANLAYVEPEYITLTSDGAITGDYTGTWTTTDGTCYIQLTMGDETYNGVLLTETMEGKVKKTITFTAVGTSSEVAVWGYQYSGTDAIEMEAEALTLPAQTVNGTPLDLITTGTYGTTITWASSDTSIIATDGTVTVPEDDTTVTLTATISNDDASGTYTYEVKVIGSNSIDEDGNITVWTSDETYDLTSASAGTYQFVNYFNSEIGTAGLEIYNGVSIEFTATRSGDYNYLSNIIGINTGLTSGKITNGLYFTGGSYLGFNHGDGTYYDANVDSTNWATGTDYIGSGSAVKIKILLLSNGYEVYADGELVYSNSTVDAGDTSGKNVISNYYTVLSYLNSTATEMDFGAGSWWTDSFQGTISNITLTVLGEDPVDTCGYAYYANYSNAGGEASDWTVQDSGYLYIANDGDSYGNYIKYAYNTGVSGSRYAYMKFSEDEQLSGEYHVSVDVQLTAGQSGTSTTSNFAIMGTDASGYTSHTTGGISSGYILKLENNYSTSGTSNGSTEWVINGDDSNTITIPSGSWVTITADVNTDEGTAYVVIKDDDTTYYAGTVEIDGTGTLGGIAILRGRGYGTVSVDNIKVYQDPTISFLGGSLWMDTSDYTKTALRFGYKIDLGSIGLEDVVASGEEDADQPTWSWTWSVDGTSYGGTVEGVNYIDNEDGTITTNLVITDIPSDYYTTDMNSTLTFTYCLGGETITITNAEQTRSVEQVATAIQTNSTDADEIAYAEQILALISE